MKAKKIMECLLSGEKICNNSSWSSGYVYLDNDGNIRDEYNMPASIRLDSEDDWIIIGKDVLTPMERQYLSLVIEPFRMYYDDMTVTKKTIETGNEYLTIEFNGMSIDYPALEENKMYRGLEPNKVYTVKELEL